MQYDEIVAVVELCHFPDYSFVVVGASDGVYIRAYYDEADTVTGKMETQRTRRWPISPHTSKSEIVQTLFKCVLTSVEHRVREHFHYRNQAVFNPHFDVDIIHAICAHELLAKRPRS